MVPRAVPVATHAAAVYQHAQPEYTLCLVQVSYGKALEDCHQDYAGRHNRSSSVPTCPARMHTVPTDA